MGIDNGFIKIINDWKNWGQKSFDTVPLISDPAGEFTTKIHHWLRADYHSAESLIGILWKSKIARWGVGLHAD